MGHTLEYAMHQNNGDEEKTRKWLDRFSLSDEKKEEILKSCLFKDFLSFDGSKVTVVTNNNYKYDNGTNY